MDKFVSRFKSQVTGVLSGFDRLVFRGSLIELIREGGMYSFLTRAGVRLLDFKSYVLKTSDAVKEAALTEARKHGRPVRYLHSSHISKEDFAHKCSRKIPPTRG